MTIQTILKTNSLKLDYDDVAKTIEFNGKEYSYYSDIMVYDYSDEELSPCDNSKIIINKWSDSEIAYYKKHKKRYKRWGWLPGFIKRIFNIQIPTNPKILIKQCCLANGFIINKEGWDVNIYNCRFVGMTLETTKGNFTLYNVILEE